MEKKTGKHPTIPPGGLRRTSSKEKETHTSKKVEVSAGPIDKVVDMVFNPSREKMPEFTVIDRIQARLLPQLEIINIMWSYVIEVAFYRQDADEYERVYMQKKPATPNLLDEFMYKTAQWQKSKDGMNLKSAVDLALADIESNMGEDGFGGTDAWKD